MIKSRLGIDAAQVPGKTGEFKVIVDGETVAERGGNWLTRSFGAGYPDLDHIVDTLQAKQQAAGASK